MSSEDEMESDDSESNRTDDDGDLDEKSDDIKNDDNNELQQNQEISKTREALTYEVKLLQDENHRLLSQLKNRIDKQNVKDKKKKVSTINMISTKS